MTSPLCPTLCINRQKYTHMISTTCASSKILGAHDTLFLGKDKSRVRVHEVASIEIPGLSRIQQRRRLHLERIEIVSAFPTAAELRGDSYLENDWDEDEEEMGLSESLAAEERPAEIWPKKHQATNWKNSALSFCEGLCLTATFLTVLKSVVQAWKNNSLVSSSPYVRVNLPSATLWHIIPLLLALLFRFFISPRNATESKEVNELTAGAYAARGTSGNGRIQLMEKDLGSAVRTISQVVKAVEKLGVRFRVTRRTLRDPIRETGALVEQTSQFVEVLGLRAERLETELQQTQLLMLAMQDQSARQLALFSETMAKSQHDQRELQKKVGLLQQQLNSGGGAGAGGEPIARKSPPLTPTSLQSSRTVGSRREMGGDSAAKKNKALSRDEGLLQRIGSLGLGLIGRTKSDTISNEEGAVHRDTGDVLESIDRPQSEEGSLDKFCPENVKAWTGNGMGNEGAPEGGRPDDRQQLEDSGEWKDGYGRRLAGVDFWANGVSRRRGEATSIRGKILKEQALQGEFGHTSKADEGQGFERHVDKSVGNSVKAWFGARSGRVDKKVFESEGGSGSGSLVKLMDLEGKKNEDQGRWGRRGSKPGTKEKL